ncbi:MAG: stage V sporulation protein AE [Bacillota bacterium]
MAKKKVIVVTDGDRKAKAAVRQAARNLGLLYLERSAGNPTEVGGEELADLVKQSTVEPVIVMFDDQGRKGEGAGEKALEELAKDAEVEIVGALAVASDTEGDKPVKVDESVTREGEVTKKPVSKSGIPEAPGHERVEGDTVGVLARLRIPRIIGIGDLGKMDGQDAVDKGALITTRAIREILEQQGL